MMRVMSNMCDACGVSCVCGVRKVRDMCNACNVWKVCKVR